MNLILFVFYTDTVSIANNTKVLSQERDIWTKRQRGSRREKVLLFFLGGTVFLVDNKKLVITVKPLMQDQPDERPPLFSDPFFETILFRLHTKELVAKGPSHL